MLEYGKSLMKHTGGRETHRTWAGAGARGLLLATATGVGLTCSTLWTSQVPRARAKTVLVFGTTSPGKD